MFISLSKSESMFSGPNIANESINLSISTPKPQILGSSYIFS